MRTLIFLLAAAVLAGTARAESPLKGEVKAIDGESVQLQKYVDKVVLVVNVASKCGYTPQYKQLQALYEQHREQGLVVLGFPCNQFGGQEPGSEAEILAFCRRRYDVSFPMFAKVKVNGEEALPLYRYLTSKEVPIADTGPVKWNFEKFLFDRSGELVARFRSGVKPDAAAVQQAIAAALGAE